MEQPLITVVKGQNIFLDPIPNANTAIVYNDKEFPVEEVLLIPDATIGIPTTSDKITTGNYKIVIVNQELQIIMIQPVKIRGLFEKENRADTLREQISLLDKVITAKLSDDQGVLQQLSINNKTLVYSSLADLIALVDSLRAQLGNEIEKANRKKGKAPFKQIKLILRG